MASPQVVNPSREDPRATPYRRPDRGGTEDSVARCNGIEHPFDARLAIGWDTSVIERPFSGALRYRSCRREPSIDRSSLIDPAVIPDTARIRAGFVRLPPFPT